MLIWRTFDLFILVIIKYAHILVSPKDIPCIHFVLHIVKAAIVAVGDDGMSLLLEGIKVVDDFAAEEGLAIFEGWLVDDDLSTLRLDALHDTLNAALAEVVRV